MIGRRVEVKHKGKWLTIYVESYENGIIRGHVAGGGTIRTDAASVRVPKRYKEGGREGRLASQPPPRAREGRVGRKR